MSIFGQVNEHIGKVKFALEKVKQARKTLFMVITLEERNQK